MTYLHEKNSTNQAATGKKGRENCRVTGMIKDIAKRVETEVFTIRPGYSIIDKQKAPRTAISTYWPS